MRATISKVLTMFFVTASLTLVSGQGNPCNPAGRQRAYEGYCPPTPSISNAPVGRSVGPRTVAIVPGPTPQASADDLRDQMWWNANNEAEALVQQISTAADPCPYLPRFLQLIHEMDSVSRSPGQNGAYLKSLATNLQSNCPTDSQPMSSDRDPVVDPGSVAPNPNIDDLLSPVKHALDQSDCAAALAYVNTPGEGLDKDLSTEVGKYQAYKEGLALVQEAKADLLSDSWWATSSGPLIAARIEFLADGVKDVMSIVNPEATAFSTTTNRLLNVLSVATKGIKAAYENRQSLKSAAKAAAEAVNKELSEQQEDKQHEGNPLYGIYKYLKDYGELIETSQDASEYQKTVQAQVRNLDEQINTLSSQRSTSVARQQAIANIRDAVIGVCVQKPLLISPPR